MDSGVSPAPAANNEVTQMEMRAAALKGQVHASGEAFAGSLNANAAGLNVQDSVSISANAYAAAAAAEADTE